MRPCNKRLPAMLVIAVVVCGLLGMANAQPRIVHVAPTAFGILNDTIAGDTTATGERVDSSTVYELERGPNAYYTLNGTIEHSGYHLIIVAEEGEGDRPKLVPGIITGGEASRCFGARGDLTLKGLYLTNVDQEGSIFSTKNIVRASGEGTRIVIDDCHFNGDHQSFIRLDSHHQSYYITNSIFSWSVDNGRAFDRRGNITDTLIVENCTFYNIISKALREGGSGYVRYLKYDHCTFYNIGEEFMEFEQIGELIFTNNMIVNAGFLGECAFYEDPVAPLMEGIDTVSHRELDSLLTLEGKTQTIEFRNNNFYLDPAIVAAHASLTLGDSLVNAGGVVQRAVFDSLGLTLVDTTTMTRETITFTDVPILDTTLSIIKTVWEEFGGESDYQSPFDHGGVGGFGEAGFGTMPFDFTYPTTTACYTAGDGGTPLGDLNWFPEFLAVEDGKDLVPDGFALSQNYPNPFNPNTSINFALPKSTVVTLVVYDLLGREVARLVDGYLEAGYQQVVWNGQMPDGSEVSSGLYIVRMVTPEFTRSIKMLMLK